VACDSAGCSGTRWDPIVGTKLGQISAKARRSTLHNPTERAATFQIRGTSRCPSEDTEQSEGPQRSLTCRSVSEETMTFGWALGPGLHAPSRAIRRRLR
jgi:hypothetical protein